MLKQARKRPLDIAKSKGHSKIVDMLQSAMLNPPQKVSTGYISAVTSSSLVIFFLSLPSHSPMPPSRKAQQERTSQNFSRHHHKCLLTRYVFIVLFACTVSHYQTHQHIDYPFNAHHVQASQTTSGQSQVTESTAQSTGNGVSAIVIFTPSSGQ